MDHLETIEKELKDVLIRYLKALAPANPGDDIQLLKEDYYEHADRLDSLESKLEDLEPGSDNQLEEHEDRIDSLECKIEDIENRLDNASLDI